MHVLGRYEEWAFIECYSSSFHGSRSKAWNELVQGWVPARYLRTVEPDQNMGLVVDKLTQRLYVFVEGRLYATLLCSTGKANVRQPYNETRSGEFLLVSSVGEFRSDGMWCAYGLRYNGDDLIHEVPHLKLADGSKTYVRGESRLGIKASVGCIRVQRKKDPNGVNMYWIWQNRRMNTRLVIWEDWQGRQIKVPDADSLLYYNPAGGLYYHACEHCSAAPGIDLTAFRYDSLEDAPYADLLRCEYCTPPLREAEIAEINALYAPGGDHDPALTEARQKEP